MQSIPITLIPQNDFDTWLAHQTAETKAWLQHTQFLVKPGNTRLIPDSKGNIAQVVCCVENNANLWSVGSLPYTLPEGNYAIENCTEALAIGWGLGSYQFTRYKKPERKPAQLVVPDDIAAKANVIIDSINFARDLINTPTDDMGPTEFAAAAKALAKDCGANFSEIVGEDLLKQNYASIFTVGRASDDSPRLVDIRWGNPKHPKLTLVGKGVCFDSGGLDLKPSAYMLLMRKDMAGGAHALALARMIMKANLPICLRVLIPVVENVVSGNAYRPGDIIKSRSGLTIEVGNTDCEGRVILADALTEAVSEKPNLLIDFTTLTGAARVALGTDLPAVFSNNDEVVHQVIQYGEKVNDPLWRLPLFAMYRDYIKSSVADINNNSTQPYAGAITAGLFLKEFVPDSVPWMHFDMMAWNIMTRPGRPLGAEVLSLRALFTFLTEKFTSMT